MSRIILVYGQPAAGKSYALRNLDPKATLIIDADTKNGLPWRGWKKDFNAANDNFISDYRLDRIIAEILKTGQKRPHVKTLVVDGFSTAMNRAEMFNPNKGFSKWEELAANISKTIMYAQAQRDDLTVVFNAHVTLADPNVNNSVDELRVPGKKLEKNGGLESLFIYVFYAKWEENEFFFETAPFNSTARSPFGCFPSRIPNDIAYAIDIINKFESGDSND